MTGNVNVRGYLRRRKVGSLESTQTASSRRAARRAMERSMTRGERRRLKILRVDPVPFSDDKGTHPGPVLRDYRIVVGVRKGKEGGWDP